MDTQTWMALRSVEMHADVGRVEAAWEVARLGEVVSDTRASDARVFAHEHVKSELCDLSEEQLNIAPYHDTAPDTNVPIRHMDRVTLVCGGCKATYTETTTTDEEKLFVPAGDEPVLPAEPCGGFCRFNIYRAMCLADDLPPLKVAAFQELYLQTMPQEHVRVRRKKGAISDCRCCDDCNAGLGLRANQRTDAKFAIAKRKLGRHIAVIRRLRG